MDKAKATGLAGPLKGDIFASMDEKQNFALRASTTGYSFRIERNGVAEIWDVAIDNRKDAEASFAKSSMRTFKYCLPVN